MEIIDGKTLAKNIRENLKSEVEELKSKGINPKFAVILVGNDKASLTYVKSKNKACQELGIEYEEIILEGNTTMQELLEIIESLNERTEISGILLQSPIPKHLDINEAFRKISPSKDVDGFNPYNVGKLCLNQDTFVSCTPYGIMKIFDAYNIPIEGKNAVVIGRSNIVGKPMALSLLNKNATVTICHSKTEDLKEITQKADIIIAAIGKKHFVTKEMVKEGAVIIDVGINRTDEGIFGDVDFEGVKEKASYITPVPGGVGPMTVAMLMTNIVKAAKQSNQK
ncbi:MAG: bifunctional methylenetetrahydrofolate dehydrogenase/methenyltetrahydrofolate cyclohydrolase FolD [Clostridia bacterium]|nr:bifunctional methylenetetrahydrofolate dehydrogenase/methenyltetrahydrofolate cyclohydrolase FolD [Clostridia bacterium]